MSQESNVAVVASLIADPARTAMLTALLDGRALPAGELAYASGVTAQTASSHLSRLLLGSTPARWLYRRSATEAQARSRLDSR